MTEPRADTLTIVVVTWNSEGEIVACLDALGPPPADWQICVVDNASTDRTVGLIRQRAPWAHLRVNERNEGFARACNSVLRSCRSDFVLLLNPDTECRAATVTAALMDLRERSRAGVLGVRLHDAQGRTQPSCFRFPTPALNLLQFSGAYRLLPRAARANLLLGSNWDHGRARAVDWLMGAFLLVRRSALETTGPLDETYELFAEDLDWCWRFQRAGFEVWFTPEVGVLHHGGRSTGRLGAERRAELSLSGKYRFCATRFGRAAARFVQLTDLAGFASRLLLHSLRPGTRALPSDVAWFRAGLREASRALRRPLPERGALAT